MALLERHGIGNGKYKVGGSYGNNVFLDDASKGRGEVLLQYNETESSKVLQCVEFGEDGNFYVGSRSGTNNLFKLDSQGTLLWETNLAVSPTYIIYDKFEDVIWVYDSSGNEIIAFDTDGSVLLNIPYNVSTFTGMEVTEDYVIVSNFGSTSVTTVNSITFYDKNGSLVRNLNNQGVRSINVIDDFLYVVDLNRLRKYELSSSQVWDYAIPNNSVAANKSQVVKINGQLLLYVYISGSPGTANLYLINDSNGTLIRTQARSANTITPANSDDYSLVNSFFLLNKNESNVLLISTESTFGTTLKYINDSLKITSRRSTGVTTAPLVARYKATSINEDSNVAFVANKAMYFIDPKEYYKIIK